MKPTLITIALLTIFSLTSKAQKPIPVITVQADSNAVYTAVEKTPSFPGGEKGFIHFLIHTVRYPASGVENHIQGKVVLTFIVEKDGSLSDIRVAKGVSTDIDDEAIRVMKASPKWAPGMQGGRAVRVQYTQPISFTLTN